ncbi:class I SAM-dependent methyltransferase [Crocinitomicaceae bacterium CZZ-1]|uniref:Class I SAM-dependent methyltransferase n=1 Tax=Taishania pollutisoli TaxID=2766479 RepID=A0A8J6PDY8_9FLAO|nr:class I SAM-dependent methyltransferase [Taishania pollutisoli]MBC9813018.1 class I SAM-dependent methyltransferase [Taishania pollutisoli]
MEDHYKETFETWNKVAMRYQEKFMELEIYNSTYDAFLDSLSGNHPKVLEIGCGPGNITRYLLSQRPDLQLLGTDIAPNMIQLAAGNNPTATFIQLDCRKLHQLTGLFNGIITGFCIPYINEEEVQNLFADCGNRLTNNGVLYLSFVEGDAAQSGFQTGSSGDRVYFYYHQLTVITQLLNHFGFIQPEVFHIPYTLSDDHTVIHTVVIARKEH